MSYDVVVVGGGVLGAAIAARLAQTSASVCLLERQDDLCQGASKGNAGVAVSHLAAPGTLEARLIAASSPRWEDIAERLDVAFERRGALVVALDRDERQELEPLAQAAREGGAPGARVVDRHEALALEPLLTERQHGAVLLPGEGIIDSLRLVFAYARLAALNGAHIATASEVVGATVSDGRVLSLSTRRGDVAARFVVNAAGLGLAHVSALAGGRALEVTPRNGQYWVMDPAWGRRLSRIVIPVRGPAPQTRGVQVIPTTSGAALVGPTAEDMPGGDDTATRAPQLQTVLEHGRRLVPSLDGALAIKSFAANRVVVGRDSLLLERDPRVRNLVHAGNRAIGVSCSPALAEETLALLRHAGLHAEDRPEAVDRLPPQAGVEGRPGRSRAAGSRQPRPGDGRVVCPCRAVSAEDVLVALSGPTGARTLEGVRKRTGAMAGRCQGAMCLADVARLCALALERPLAELVSAAGDGASEAVGDGA